jgi:hypothetical protein
MIVPSTRIFTAGEIETGAYLNSAVTNMGNFMLGKPVTFLRQTSNQSLATASTVYAIAWSVADVNRDNNWSSSANTLWTCNTAGWYQFAGGGSFASATSTSRQIAWYKTPSGGSASLLNYGFIVDRLSATLAVSITAQPVMVYMNVGDAMDLRLFTTAASTTTNSASIGYQCWMSAQWVSL